MDCFQGDAKVVPRVGLCGALVDERGLTAESACLEANRIRVSRARQDLELKRETVENTKRRLQDESDKTNRDVRDAIAYAKRLRAVGPASTVSKPTGTKSSALSTTVWDALLGEDEDEEDEEDEIV